MFGRLTLDAFKHDWIEQSAGLSVALAGIALFVLLTYKRRWKWLWNEWITTLDPKRIGVMYLVVSFLMLAKGLMDGLMMRAQQAFAVGDVQGYLQAPHFQQIFTAHGVTMIFFVGMGIVFGLMNLLVPLQIGARDVAFPFLNAVSFWLFSVGALLLLASMNVGKFSGAGWVGYPPLSNLQYNPGVGVDYWIWTLQIAGIGSLLSGINFWSTIVKMRCPGMTFRALPIFIWAAFATLVLIMFAFPILTGGILLLTLDRVLGMHFFTADFGGNPMLYIDLIWAWGHPEVYILIFPTFGIFSEVVSTLSQKKLFGYTSMIWAIIFITFLSFIVWLHHFFTMGAGSAVNAFFGIMTMLIAIPTGVKIFNWLFTMCRGRILMMTPMIWFLGFVFFFSIGGMVGVLMSLAPADFQIHNSLFLIAHFHSMLIPGLLFGYFSAFSFWFPKFTGFKLDEKLGRYACMFWIAGFFVAFMPLYVLGLMGATRRLNHYSAETGWQPLFIIAALGAGLIACGLACQVLQVMRSIKERDKNRAGSDPWDAKTLEWATSSPPPIYNFAIIPTVHGRNALWEMKKGVHSLFASAKYTDIDVPENTPMPFFIGFFTFFFAFGIIWYIWWLSAICLLGNIICLIVHLSREDFERTITAEEVANIEQATGKK